MKQQVHGGDVYRHPNTIDFSSNINPLGTPASVIDAVTESLKQIAHYPDILYSELRKSLSEYEGVPEDMIICGNGAAELIFLLVLALKPKRALIPVPTFAEYEQALTASECEVSHYKMEPDFNLDVGILEAITPDYDVLFLCTPNNPTGFLIEPEFLRKIIKRCWTCDVFLVIDECFQDFIAEAKAYTMIEALAENERLFILKAFTKRYAMAGIRLGYGLCSNQAFLGRMNQVTQPWNVSIPAQAAGVAALKETAYVEKARQLIQKENTFLKQALHKLPLHIYDSQANYIFFKGPPDLYEKCLTRGILIRSCSNYPGLSQGFYRIAIRTHEENESLIQVLQQILNKEE